MKKEKQPVLFYEDSRRPASEYTRLDAEFRCITGTSTRITGTKLHWTAFQDQYRLALNAKSTFWKKRTTQQCTFKDGKLYGDIRPFVQKICSIYRLDWIMQHQWVLSLINYRKDLWVAILSGKITNPEKCCKYVSKKDFGKVYSYKALKNASMVNPGVSLYDLRWYTTNSEEALKVFMERPSYIDLLRDVLRYCRALGTKMNPKWSEKRLHEEHQHQIEQVELQKVEELSDKQIAPAFSRDGLSLILNERECYLEGCTMHNCIHRCYWPQVERGGYFIAKGTVNGEYVNLGFYADRDGLRYDQVHTSYNGTVTGTTSQMCREWIKTYKDEIKSLWEHITNQKTVQPFDWSDVPEEIVDIPF